MFSSQRFPAVAQTFLKPVFSKESTSQGGSKGTEAEGKAEGREEERETITDWRPPYFGELCCQQTKLADTLDASEWGSCVVKKNLGL